MRLFAILAGICLLSPSALAETAECKAIPDAGARLACYDRPIKPPASADKSAAAKPVDTIGAEDAQMNARLKNICRGC
jgi:hypothetical protein